MSGDEVMEKRNPFNNRQGIISCLSLDGPAASRNPWESNKQLRELQRRAATILRQRKSPKKIPLGEVMSSFSETFKWIDGCPVRLNRRKIAWIPVPEERRLIKIFEEDKEGEKDEERTHNK